MARRKVAEANQALETMISTDALTGVPNRRRLDLFLKTCLGQDRQPLTVMLADIDFFKALNDRLGHQVGDTCLRAVAGAFAAALQGSQGLVARYGGEEFAIVLPATDRQAGRAFADKLRRRIENLALPHPAAPLGVVTVSIGVVSVPASALSEGSALLEDADRALYAAKAAGRNRVEVFAAPPVTAAA